MRSFLLRRLFWWWPGVLVHSLAKIVDAYLLRPRERRIAAQQEGYEQLAKVYRGKFLVQLGRTSLIPNREPAKRSPDDAMDVLYRMGLDVLPVLADALDDTTPSRTFKYDSHRPLPIRKRSA